MVSVRYCHPFIVQEGKGKRGGSKREREIKENEGERRT